MERKNQALMEAYARVLRERRKAANLSQEELAFRTDLSMSYISFLETCRRQPTLTVMDAICRELGVSLTEFIGEVEGDVENNR
ncbi:XRE family transcriptional regulator [Roseobacter denitrificans]|uniref:DNA-binding protein n=2 Tax=Roseobacter denitrificans TaxID=2434 RepID=Q16C05_ROSDO|nr:DNA-binding protein [Roseobacter denitrificans OCh 114]AVL53645.1 XRE family transcriptional regulator [Roseobacter denitrificans]SFF73413.1 Helix-turn-helix [Roseobacter denitrificans OCh 114]